eukprot:241316-Pyramimonas_sp.AAC.1
MKDGERTRPAAEVPEGTSPVARPRPRRPNCCAAPSRAPKRGRAGVRARAWRRRGTRGRGGGGSTWRERDVPRAEAVGHLT